MQGGTQTKRTGPDYHHIGIHQAIVPQTWVRDDRSGLDGAGQVADPAGPVSWGATATRRNNTLPSRGSALMLS
jgi:hypothetical protein